MDLSQDLGEDEDEDEGTVHIEGYAALGGFYQLPSAITDLVSRPVLEQVGLAVNIKYEPAITMCLLCKVSRSSPCQALHIRCHLL